MPSPEEPPPQSLIERGDPSTLADRVWWESTSSSVCEQYYMTEIFLSNQMLQDPSVPNLYSSLLGSRHLTLLPVCQMENVRDMALGQPRSPYASHLSPSYPCSFFLRAL